MAPAPESQQSNSQAQNQPLPPGMILGPDGKPCKICTAFRDWKPPKTAAQAKPATSDSASSSSSTTSSAAAAAVASLAVAAAARRAEELPVARVEGGGLPCYATARLEALPGVADLEPVGERHAEAWVGYWKQQGFLNV